MRTTVEASVTIGRPPEAVTRVILDPTKAVPWTSDLVRWSGRGTRPLMWILLLFIRGAVARGARHDLNRLKDLLEQVE